MFLEGEFTPRGLVKATFLGIFVHFSTYTSDGFFLSSSNLDLEVANHSTNTIISKVRKLNKTNIITTISSPIIKHPKIITIANSG